MNLAELNYDELLKMKPYEGDLVFNVNGMTADEYISKITKEMNAIDLSSVPIDRWDIVVTFALAVLEVAGDFFIGDPSFKNSLANKNGPFCKWLEKFHDKASSTSKWWGHKGSVLDYQKDATKHLTGMVGDHRGKTFSHDMPLASFIYGAKVKEDDSTGTKVAKRTYDGFLITHDLLCFSISIYSLCTGKFVDFGYYVDKSTGEKVFGKIVQDGFEQYNIFEAIVKYVVHMLADFCSSRSLPIPGWSLLTHIPNRDVEAFALKLYRNGMNLRTMALQSVPIGVTELLMSVYIWVRSKDRNDESSEALWEHKKHKLLLISHGITAAVNVGKVIIAEAPWRLNLAVIARTFQLVWQIIAEETKLTNRYIEKLDAGILKARIESCKTLVLLDQAVYETDNVERMLHVLSKRTKDTSENIDSILSEVDSEFKSMLKKIGG